MGNNLIVPWCEDISELVYNQILTLGVRYLNVIF